MGDDTITRTEVFSSNDLVESGEDLHLTLRLSGVVGIRIWLRRVGWNPPPGRR
jgi:hypothetical protein